MIIRNTEELRKVVKSLKSQRKKIVSANGCFDLLHIGHIKFLEEAKRQGDVLIVGLNSDSSIKRSKRNNRPLMLEKDRAEIVNALRCVDYVVIMNDLEISIPLIKLVTPDVHVNGREYGYGCIESNTVKNSGARLHLVKKYGIVSTTAIIDKIKNG